MKSVLIVSAVLLSGLAYAGPYDPEVRIDREGSRVDVSQDRWSITLPKETGDGDKRISTETRINRRWNEKRVEFDLRGMGLNMTLGKRIK